MSWRRTAKELIRDGIAKFGLARLHAQVRRASGQNVDHLFHSSLSERFSAIYANRVWLNSRSEGALSGLGSELTNTEPFRHRLPDILRTLGTSVLLDVGCGDFTWMNSVELPCRYIGTDIVDEVIQKNIALYSTPSRSFTVMDATQERLPGADTVLCREVLFHLSFRDIWRLLGNVHKSDARYLITTNDAALMYNADILSGDFRMLNLLRPPFLFPAPIASMPDDAVATGRALSVWKCADLPSTASHPLR
jgi:Methyltransferase domain